MSKASSPLSSPWRSHDWILTVSSVIAAWWGHHQASVSHMFTAFECSSAKLNGDCRMMITSIWNRHGIIQKSTKNITCFWWPLQTSNQPSVCSQWYAGQTTWKSRSKDNWLHPARITVVVKQKMDLAVSVFGAGRTEHLWELVHPPGHLLLSLSQQEDRRNSAQ